MQHLSGSRTCTWALMHADTHRCIQIHPARRLCCHCAYTICTWQQISRFHLLSRFGVLHRSRKTICCHTQNTTIHAMCHAQRTECSMQRSRWRVPRDLAVCFSFHFLSIKKKNTTTISMYAELEKNRHLISATNYA